MSVALTALDRLVIAASLPTLGLELPLDNDWGATRLRADRAAGRPFGVPDLTRHAELARLADELGFAGFWVRDVPSTIPSGSATPVPFSKRARTSGTSRQ
ncbi:hypothetical protein OIC43_41985 [Streptomyces sp. NBC_00825]|uniref:hypothetical protein n=1 Tax=unclassified Streptomyces TaxID=2593676 RepID=UPI0022567355|nr:MULTISPECIES: hypothetical protein [unclassified Streptomyces]WTB51979.1 hypothetical protein OG832_01700 [Streptomyces sp. NBC_00826]WTH95131.1 hypothetical protein OIC43_41985 [Streptomyces sp. NBC_00825]WTI03865.1 hypothetical protein OHA23_41960 [Streptomyces sp. NBC_00822]MCX4869451.1 hypothetical protein [Streptomyces sp. NBC_00906]MCX4900690.1 hypothetical protein [Streptomyces sp. NBC_00892]